MAVCLVYPNNYFGKCWYEKSRIRTRVLGRKKNRMKASRSKITFVFNVFKFEFS
jgi:hypothetical protein